MSFSCVLGVGVLYLEQHLKHGSCQVKDDKLDVSFGESVHRQKSFNIFLLCPAVNVSLQALALFSSH